MNPRKAQILAFIRQYITDHGYPPSIREIANSVGLAVSSTHDALLQLERDGVLRRGPSGSSRALVLCEAGGDGGVAEALRWIRVEYAPGRADERSALRLADALERALGEAA